MLGNSVLKKATNAFGLNLGMLKAMPKFLSYRRLIDYNFLHQHYDWETVDGERKKRWLRLKAEIEADEPLTNYPF